MENDDRELIERLRRRDQAAFRVLYERYWKRMVLFAESYLYDEAEAKDAVQDVFCRLWEGAGRLPRVTSVRGYLLTALRNRCLNALRERRVRDEHQDKLLEAQLASGTEEEVVDEEVHRRLHEALDAMPERCREVILLKVVDGLTNREIAARTGVTEGTVKTQVQRAYKFLRDRLLPVMAFIEWVEWMYK